MNLRSLLIVPAVVAVGTLTSTAAEKKPITTLAIGAQAPDFSLPGVDGKTHQLADFAESKAMVIIFTLSLIHISEPTRPY